MAENPIRKEDIIDGEAIQKQIEELTADLLKLASVLKDDMVVSAKAAKKELEGVDITSKEGQVKAKELTQEVIDLTKSYNALSKATDQLNKEAKKIPQTFDANDRSYNAISARLKKLVNDYKSVSDEGIRKKMVPQIQALDKELKSLDLQMGRHQRNVGNYSSVFKNLGSTFLKVTGLIAGLSAGIRFMKDVFESTGRTSDKFQATISGLKQGFEAVKRAVATLDFTDFVKNVKNAIDEGRRYAENLDEVDEKTRALRIAEAEGRNELMKQREIQNDMRKSLEQRNEAGKEAIRIEERLQELRTQIAEQAFKNEVDNLASIANQGKEVNDLMREEILLYVRRDAEFMKTFEVGQKVNELIKERNKLTEQEARIGRTSQSEELKNVISLLSQFTDEQRSYGELVNRVTLPTDEKYALLTEKIVALEEAKGSALENTIRIRSRQSGTEAKLIEQELKRASGQGIIKELQAKEVSFAKETSAQLVNIKKAEIKNIAEADAANAAFQKETQRQVTDEKLKSYADEADKYIEIASLVNDSFASILEKRKQKELSAAGDNAKERERIEKEYANKEKALAITSALINTAGGVTRALKDYPYPLSAVIGAIVGGLGAVQIGVIASQKFAEGGYTGDGSFRDETGEKVAGVVHQEEYVIPKEPTRKYRRLLEAIHADNPMAIAEELKNRQFHQVWGGVQPKIAEAYRQDPYTQMMYQIMRNRPEIYTDSDGNTVKEYPDGRKEIIKKK